APHEFRENSAGGAATGDGNRPCASTLRAPMDTPIATAGLVSGPALLRRRMAWQSAPWVPAAAVAVGFSPGSLLGFSWRFPGSGISFFWPPTAVLTAALLMSPPRAWGWLLASALGAHGVAHAQNGVPVTAWPAQVLPTPQPAGP